MPWLVNNQGKIASLRTQSDAGMRHDSLSRLSDKIGLDRICNCHATIGCRYFWSNRQWLVSQPSSSLLVPVSWRHQVTFNCLSCATLTTQRYMYQCQTNRLTVFSTQFPVSTASLTLDHWHIWYTSIILSTSTTVGLTHLCQRIKLREFCSDWPTCLLWSSSSVVMELCGHVTAGTERNQRSRIEWNGMEWTPGAQASRTAFQMSFPCRSNIINPAFTMPWHSAVQARHQTLTTNCDTRPQKCARTWCYDIQHLVTTCVHAYLWDYTWLLHNSFPTVFQSIILISDLRPQWRRCGFLVWISQFCLHVPIDNDCVLSFHFLSFPKTLMFCLRLLVIVDKLVKHSIVIAVKMRE